MAGKFETPISIREAIGLIDSHDFLVPAIQRDFVWSHEQIASLFDSIMRGYPINSFMLWRVKSTDLKENYKFYNLLQNYCAVHKTSNPEQSTRGMKDFDAIIDGQQRLTSIYIGLKGTYAYKLPYKRTTYSERNFPARQLYLNLERPLDPENDTENLYDFRFLIKQDVKEDSYWFEVGQILNLKTPDEVAKYALSKKWGVDSFAWKTLFLLHSKMEELLINYYREYEQNPDQVLKVFIRANSGGTELSFADLLMSMSIANWDIDAKKEMKDLIEQVLDTNKIEINQNFILKTCLVLCGLDVRFRLGNFTRSNIKVFEKEWIPIKESIKSGINLICHLGHNEKTIQSKNALIPIIHYIYKNNLYEKIDKPLYYDSHREGNIIKIQKWFNITLLKGIFGGHSDATLQRIQKIIQNFDGMDFPFEKIVDEFKGDRNHNYSFSDEVLEELLAAQKGTQEATTVLSLLYPNMDYYNHNYHDDHLHPQARILNGEIEKQVKPEDVDFVRDPANWNSVVNLQRLESSVNESKNNLPLSKWVIKNHKTHSDLYISSTTSLEEKDFVQFIKDRKTFLKNKLKKLVE